MVTLSICWRIPTGMSTSIMYLSDRPALTGSDNTETVPSPRRPRLSVPGNVVALGMVSAFTDVSSEMVTSVAPAYLALTLAGSVTLIGAIDAAQQGVAALVRIIAGIWSDRRGRYKPAAIAGYGLSALMRVLTLPLGGTANGFGALLAGDRIGKGIRTSPRDAMVAMSAEPGREAAAFGIHRAFDTAGAVAGPLVAATVLTVAASAYDAVWMVAALFAGLGLLVLVLWVQEPVVHTDRIPVAVERVPFRQILKDVRLRWLLVGAAALGMLSISDSIVFLAVTDGANATANWFPLLASGVAFSYLFAAVPVGVLADRIGRRVVIAVGFLFMAAAYLATVGMTPSITRAVVVAVLFGLYYACTDGVLSAVASSVVPHLPGTAIGIVTASMLAGRLIASLTVTRWWETVGNPTIPLTVWAAAAVTVAWLMWRPPSFLPVRRIR